MTSVLITGGTGSFGKTMLHGLLEEGCEDIRILSRDEEKQDALRNLLNDARVSYYIGDIRDRMSVDRAMQGVSAVFHAAALKQVPSCEFFPLEAVKTNILGSENVVRSAIDHRVKSLVCLSTDKAVHPINTMGISKAMMEKIAQSAAREIGSQADTTISCVRYGNVMYSRGSVIPLFIRQIRAQKPITVTDPQMTRFLMPLRDSVGLVKFAFENARQGDLFIKKAVASTIIDLVTALLELFDVPDHAVQVIGWRHAEKLYETLASTQELSTAEDLGDYFRLQLDTRDLNYKPYFIEGSDTAPEQEDYHSHNTERLNVEGVKRLLLSLPEIQTELKSWRAER
ncbi:MAG: SDR family NAD(P)-dependent oxidoreductase [Sphingomonadales bacterium]|nr:SDR family NAD(P)-dependent oxidoreductase [Sphingomonadales bacterium]NCP50518.1 SDR family NAD(P)-dependent oxidoreductase [Sphingomonadales bacterium]